MRTAIIDLKSLLVAKQATIRFSILIGGGAYRPTIRLMCSGHSIFLITSALTPLVSFISDVLSLLFEFIIADLFFIRAVIVS